MLIILYIGGQGADLIAGSLIKNPGGTIAPCGGYVAGRKKWVDAAAARLSAPGLGVDCGSTPGDIMRAFFQGLFLSPQMVGEAVKVLQPSFQKDCLCFSCLYLVVRH
jgi:cystathionine beta-lyase family protein involved in aluminum resistance